jgi:hypothetical protein
VRPHSNVQPPSSAGPALARKGSKRSEQKTPIMTHGVTQSTALKAMDWERPRGMRLVVAQRARDAAQTTTGRTAQRTRHYVRLGCSRHSWTD